MKSTGFSVLLMTAGLIAACGDPPPSKDGSIAANVGIGDKAKAGDKAAVDKPAAAKAKAKAVADKAGPSAPKVVSGSSLSAAQKLKAWTPLHSFLGAPVVSGSVISATEAIVVTRDNHVGITTDAGATWGFERMTTGSVAAAAGAPGGPYVVVGARGFAAISTDGTLWNELPRYTGDDLRAVAVADGLIVALGKAGGFVKVKADGSDPVKGTLPDKAKALAVRIEQGQITLAAGKTSYQSADGLTWTPIEPVASSSSGKVAGGTSQGICSVGTVARRKVVVCTVAGKAYGIGPTETLVVGKTWLALTTTGKSWALAKLPLAGIKNVAGQAGGPYHVGDGRGGVASSSDGITWTLGDDATVLDGVPEFTPRTDKCEGALPGALETCALTRIVTSPGGLPDVIAVKFVGETGLAMGNSALVAMTTDGGATWRAQSGFGLGGVFGFAVVDSKIVALGRTKVAVSTDGGQTFAPSSCRPRPPRCSRRRSRATAAWCWRGARARS